MSGLNVAQAILDLEELATKYPPTIKIKIMRVIAELAEMETGETNPHHRERDALPQSEMPGEDMQDMLARSGSFGDHVTGT